jgi:hypothetical protein
LRFLCVGRWSAKEEKTAMGEIEWQKFYSDKDFADNAGFPLSPEEAANRANQKLFVTITGEGKFYGNISHGHYHGQPTQWRLTRYDSDTHSCRVVDVRKEGA